MNNSMNDSELKNDEVARARAASTVSDDMLIIVPVRNLVLFPGTVVPVAINRERSLAAAQEAVRASARSVSCCSTIRTCSRRPGAICYKVGTVASIVRYVTARTARITSSCRASAASACWTGRTACPSWSRASST